MARAVRPSRVRLLAIAALAPQLGCYAYVPTTLDAVPAGARVRVLIATDAAQRLGPFGVTGNVVEGELQARTGDQINLLVPSVPLGSAYRAQPLYQQVMVASSDVQRVDLRRLDRFRTGVAVGGAVAVVGTVAVGALSGLWGGTPGDGGGGIQESVRGWRVRVPLPWP